MPVFRNYQLQVECATNEPRSQWAVIPPSGEDWEVELITASTTIYHGNINGEDWAVGTSNFTATPYWGDPLGQTNQWCLRVAFEFDFTFRDVALVASQEMLFRGRDSTYWMVNGVLHRTWSWNGTQSGGSLVNVRIRN